MLDKNLAQIESKIEIVEETLLKNIDGGGGDICKAALPGGGDFEVCKWEDVELPKLEL